MNFNVMDKPSDFTTHKRTSDVSEVNSQQFELLKKNYTN